jgi:DNA invertase Pin-like site-specific DNA recombinase
MCRRAYGYIRSACDDMREIERLRREMHLHARRRGLMLIEVFTDKGVASTALARQGFSALLDSLKAMAPPVVFVPSLSHLSCQPALRAELELLIRDQGAVLTRSSRGRDRRDQLRTPMRALRDRSHLPDAVIG